MKIENTEVMGISSAIRAMRNPMDSWSKSDSSMGPASFVIGPKDLELSCNLVHAGSEHRKFLREIIISADLTVPRYMWQEIDTYKVATTRNSCSTMHKLGHRDLDRSDFQDGDVLPLVLGMLNAAGKAYREKVAFVIANYQASQQERTIHLEGFDIVRWMKKHIPEGFLQKATYTMSYETALAWLRHRINHRNREWSGPGGLCEWVLSLPYMKIWYEAATKSKE
jgi:hypothetical protein